MRVGSAAGIGLGLFSTGIIGLFLVCENYVQRTLGSARKINSAPVHIL
jgi:hypothetical protein